MNERVSAKNRTSATPPVANQANSPLLHQSSLTEELSESVGSNSNISKESAGIQPTTIRRSLNWQNISVEGPSRSDGMSLPGGIQRQQEEAGTVSGDRVSADSAQKSPLELSNSTISTEKPAQKPSIARALFNRRNIPIEAPARSSASSTYPEGIQRLETSGVKEQEESTESLQMQPLEEIQAKSSSGEPQEKEEQNKELVQTKLTVGAPGDKHEQEADSMAGKVMAMPDRAVEQPIQRQAQEEQEQLQMQPLEEIQAKSSSGEPQEKEEENRGLVQTKLTVGTPGDKYEQEADNMAAKVMRMPEEAIQQPIQRQTGEETEPPKTEPPKTEPPKTEPPKTEPPKTEPPKTEPPKTEPPGRVVSLEIQRTIAILISKGFIENPNRPGSWGRFDGPIRRGNPTFREYWRYDQPEPGQPGWRGKDHVHHYGGHEHLPPDAPFNPDAPFP